MLFRERSPRRSRTAAMLAAFGCTFVGCIDRPAKPVEPHQQSGIVETIANNGIDKVDLLVMVDNSNSMRDNQRLVMAQFANMIDTLVNPLCIDMNNPTAAPVPCDPTMPNLRPQHPPVSDMHVGVVDSDLGTPGAVVPGCADSSFGDDGQMNPIRDGASESQHEPWTTAPPTFGRPADCTDPNEYPAFITFDSSMIATNANYVQGFVHDFQCNAGLYVGGCGLESQLESVWRALIWHDPHDTLGNTDVNAGFLRDDALLALVYLTDEEDGSVQNCMYAHGQPCNANALDVYQPSSNAWSHTNLNMRFYMYQPGGQQDPTWPLERYIDPNDPTAGFVGLKPGHPERVIFAAITGVPLESEFPWKEPDGTIHWDMLLGTPDPNNADNFYGRSAGPGSTAINGMSQEGLVSMYQANIDTGPAAAPDNCPLRTVPSCRRVGTQPNPSSLNYCTPDDQYFAWPSRRIVEVARRFATAPFCNGPCGNGLVASICGNDYSAAMADIVQKIQSQLKGKCLPRALQTTPDAAGDLTVQCLVQEQEPMGVTMCDPTHGRVDPPDANGIATPMTIVGSDGNRHQLCIVTQVAVDSTSLMPADVTQHGWYYDTTPDPSSGCSQRITFTNNDAPPNGSTTQLECIQSSSIPASDAGAGGD